MQQFHPGLRNYIFYTPVVPGKSLDTLLKKQTTVSKCSPPTKYNGPSIWTESHTGYPPFVAIESLETLPPETDHSFKVLSHDPDTMVLPSGLKATLLPVP